MVARSTADRKVSDSSPTNSVLAGMCLAPEQGYLHKLPRLSDGTLNRDPQWLIRYRCYDTHALSLDARLNTPCVEKLSYINALQFIGMLMGELKHNKASLSV